jgi:hypothetical protein
MRRLLMHPTAGKFRSQGSIEWPDDQYTRKRLADGSVKMAQSKTKPEETKTEEPKPEERRKRAAREEPKED